MVTDTSAQNPLPQSEEMRAVATAAPAGAVDVVLGDAEGVEEAVGVADAVGDTVGETVGSGVTVPPAPLTKAREYAH